MTTPPTTWGRCGKLGIKAAGRRGGRGSRVCLYLVNVADIFSLGLFVGQVRLEADLRMAFV